jgi:hypothetical protein
VQLVHPPPFLDTRTTLSWFGGDASAVTRYGEFVARGQGILDPEAAALAALLASGRLADVRLAHVEYGYSLRTIAAHVGVHHSTLTRQLRADAPKGV